MNAARRLPLRQEEEIKSFVFSEQETRFFLERDYFQNDIRLRDSAESIFPNKEKEWFRETEPRKLKMREIFQNDS